MAVTAITAATLAAIKRKTGYSLPDRPAEYGMTPETIRKRFYEALTDPTNSFYAEIQRIIAEVNAEITVLEGNLVELRYDSGYIQWKLQGETEWTNLYAISLTKGDKGISYRSKGAWSPTTDYVNDADYIDVVIYGGDAFFCKVSIAGNAGNTDPLTDTTHWDYFVKSAPTHRNRGVWDGDTSYYSDEDHIDLVNYDGDMYYCKLTILTTGNSNPTVDTTHWGPYLEKGISFCPAGPWDADTSYRNDSSFVDVVEYQGKAYSCKLSISGTGNTEPPNDATHWELFLDNTMETDLDTTTTVINHTLADNEDKSFSQATITGVTITIPATVAHGFISSVTYKSGASPVQITFTNNSGYTVKLIRYGLPITYYTPTANRTVELMFYCNGLNIDCVIHEVE